MAVKFGEAAELAGTVVQPEECVNLPYIGLEHIGQGTLHLTGIGRSEEVSSAKLKFNKGDILFGKLRPYFRKLVMPSFEGICSTDIWVVKPKNGVDPRFLYYWMASKEFVDKATQGSEGTKMPRAKWDYVKQFESLVDDPSQQAQIGRILGSLDDKIRLNTETNDTLETIAQAKFKSWFVDFDPVKAKAEGRQPEGMDAATAGLFPDRFTESDLGLIPEGWGKTSLSSIAEFNPTETIRKGNIAPYLDMAALPTSGCWPDAPIQREFSSGTKFRNGDTLLARITPCLENGKTAYVMNLLPETVGWGSTEFIVMRPRALEYSELIYILARTPNFRAHAIQSMTGTSGRQRAQSDMVANYNIALPPNNRIVSAFSEITAKLFNKIKENSLQNETLSALRDTLLPRLISGKLRISGDE